eukprot:6468885-Amphidinium_carterae.1
MLCGGMVLRTRDTEALLKHAFSSVAWSKEEVAHLGYFVLSLLIGHFTVSGVTPALHTPLISVTNVDELRLNQDYTSTVYLCSQ